MRRRAYALLLLSSSLLAGACAGTAELTPRQSVVRVLEVGIGTANPDAIRPLIGPTYTQHNPRVVDGPQGLLGFVTKFKERPAWRTRNTNAAGWWRRSTCFA
jgi:hypothetical protein